MVIALSDTVTPYAAINTIPPQAGWQKLAKVTGDEIWRLQLIESFHSLTLATTTVNSPHRINRDRAPRSYQDKEEYS